MFILFANLEIFCKFTNKQNKFLSYATLRVFFLTVSSFFFFYYCFISSNGIYLENDSYPKENI